MIPEREYLKIQELMPISAINLIVLWQNKFLLIYRDKEPAKNQWWVPGGRIFKNETLLEAVKRKLKDLNLIGEIIRQGATHEFIVPDTLNEIKSGIHHISTTYIVRLSQEPKITPGIKYQWFEKIDPKLHPYVKEVLKEIKKINL